MRILLLANHLDTGGISSYLMTLSHGLVNSGHRVVIAAAGGSMVEAFKAHGIRHYKVHLRMKSEINPLLFLNLPRLLALLKDENIQVMHAQTRVTSMLASGLSRLSGIPYVTTCHGYFTPHLGRRLVPLWGEKVIAISRPVVEHLTQDMGVRPDKIELVPNGINLNAFRPVSDFERMALRQKWGLSDEPVVGMIARLSDVKGHSYLIDAMVDVRRGYPRVKCLIFGDGPLENELKKKVLADGLTDTVRFYSVSNRTAEILGLFNIYVMPSLSEGLGLSAMEAMAAGLPTVASSVGGLLDLIQDGTTGRLVPPKDPSALADVIQALLTDRIAARAMGERARAFIAANYTEDKMIKGTLGVYEKVITNKDKE